MGMASALIGESIVQAVTWKRTFRTKRMLRQQNMNQRLGSLLLRDGSLALFLYHRDLTAVLFLSGTALFT